MIVPMRGRPTAGAGTLEADGAADAGAGDHVRTPGVGERARVMPLDGAAGGKPAALIPLPKATRRDRAETARRSGELEDLRRENELIHAKLAKVCDALRDLAADLSASTRESRRSHMQLDSLRAENASLATECDRLRGLLSGGEGRR
jgi:septal ring factor EnvC (AmiA/AmiB activator)